MVDITMCTDWDCPNQDNCWRLRAPPGKYQQAYQDFNFDYDGFEDETNDTGCDYYIAIDEMKLEEVGDER